MVSTTAVVNCRGSKIAPIWDFKLQYTVANSQGSVIQITYDHQCFLISSTNFSNKKTNYGLWVSPIFIISVGDFRSFLSDSIMPPKDGRWAGSLPSKQNNAYRTIKIIKNKNSSWPNKITWTILICVRNLYSPTKNSSC